jgi:nucleotide-binding universal stress UspA family protein
MEDHMSNSESKPILICYDGSDGAQRAVAVAAGLFAGQKTIVLNVWSPISLMVAAYGGMAALPAYDDDVLQEGATKVAAAGSALAAEAGLKAQPETAEVTFEGTARTILDVAKQYDAALIVLGARGLSAFKSALLGSVSHAVTQHAHVPVLIVPPPVESETVSRSAEHAATTA